MTITGYYRVKPHRENQVLFKFGRNIDQTYLLVLEVIFNNEYGKSRFLKGCDIDESKMTRLKSSGSCLRSRFTIYLLKHPQ